MIVGESIPNMPWQDKPAQCKDVIWRHSRNPILGKNPIACSLGIYNSAVVPFKNEFVGVFRVDYKDRIPFLHFGHSKDGIHWEIENGKIEFSSIDPEVNISEYAYDPRVCKIEDTYYITWCNGYHGPTIGVAKTLDFKTFTQLENSFLPYNRNGVLFPRKINGNYAMLSRPSDTGHTPFGDIFYSESPDLCFWGKHRHVMSPGPEWWQGKKIGPGPVPIETEQGWLIFYHGVNQTCNGFVYSMGAALLDRSQPWKVLKRTQNSLLSPETDYETNGYVPNVIFPSGALSDASSGRIAIYYGAADTFTALAYTQIDQLLTSIK
jgi:beta-1,4-mannooligosaccharide/beta-1,4-mannosyl-N-acetylglucosamine phosphorylase